MSVIVAYTDGACKSNPGPSGYGVHMYKTSDEIKPKQVLGKFKTTGIGYLKKDKVKSFKLKEVGVDKVIDIYGYKEDSNTNNRAELDAIIEALRFILNYIAVDDTFSDVNKIVINSDSQYSLQLIEKLRDDVYSIDDINANKDKAKELDKLIKLITEKDIELDFRKVDGHSGDLGNDRADLLANLGVRRNINKDDNEKVIIKDFKDYWSDKFYRPTIFDSRYIFGYTVENENYIFRYGINYSDETEIGKKDNEISYVVYNVPETDLKFIKDIEREINKLTDMTVIPYVIELRNVLGKEVLRNLMFYGRDYLVLENKIKKKVYTLDDKLLATEVYPPSLSIKAQENFDYLTNLTKEFLEDKMDKRWKVKDITDNYYEINEKGKTVLKKDIKDKSGIKLKFDDYSLSVITGLDTPKRNTLKRLETLNPKVYLLRLENPTYVEYLTIVTYEMDNKLYSVLTSNLYANKIIKKVSR